MKKNSESLLLGARLICVIGALIFSVLQILGVWDKANYIAIPLLGATLVIQTVQEWNSRRGAAIFSLVAAIFVLVCTVAVILL